MSNNVIKVENLSKQYRLGDVGTGTFSHDINRWWHKVRGKDDPYLKIGEENDRTQKSNSDYVWALRDINFEVRQGTLLGIIGRNGAGKSTLLKILSKTTSPTTGQVKIKGRVASLLEVGTGFHPELTGRQNIFLNGAILGMTKNEIKQKFDEIVDFSGVERYIDTPVKRYSSGMYVRLAFAVAAHLESEILIVDEVLAVGDAEFQKKCLGKMGEVSRGKGRTVIFVSHNLQAVSSLCTQGIIVQNGRIKLDSGIDLVISQYLESFTKYELGINSASKDRLDRTSGQVRFYKTDMVRQDGNINWIAPVNEDFFLAFEMEAVERVESLSIYIAIISSGTNQIITNFKFNISKQPLNANDRRKVKIKIPAFTLRTGQYNLYAALSNESYTLYYDVIDSNVGLPSIFLTSDTIDPHYNVGHFYLNNHSFEIE